MSNKRTEPVEVTRMIDYKTIVMNWWAQGPAALPEALISALNYAASVGQPLASPERLAVLVAPAPQLSEQQLRKVLSHCVYDPVDFPLAVEKLNAELAALTPSPLATAQQISDTDILIWYEGLEAVTVNTDKPEKAIIAYVRDLLAKATGGTK